MSNTQTASVDFKWADYQADVRDALEAGDVDLVVLRTGYGGGKSITGGQWIHRGALTDRGGAAKSLVMAQDFQKGKSTTYSVFFESLPGDDTNPYDDGDPETSPIVASWHSNDKRLTYITGHTAFLGGADKWSRFAGAEFARIWCDEVGHYPPTTDLYKLHEMLVTRQRTETGPNTTLWTSTGNGFNQFYDITERQVNTDDEPLRWADRMTVIEASTEDNPFLPENGLEKIKAQFKGTEREEQGLHGGFAAAEGLVYGHFSRQTHVTSREWLADHVDDSVSPIYGYDAGWDHPRVLVQYRPTHHDQWAATRLYYETGAEFEDLCHPDRKAGWVYEQDLDRGRLYGEHEPEHLKKFARAGFAVEKANKSLDEGIPHVRGLLEQDDAGRPGLVVAEDLVELIQEFQSYKEEHVGSSRDVPDHCFVEGTTILTEAGERPIETIRPGDRVLTRDGYQPVLAAGKTKENADVVTARLTNGRELTGTANHPVHTQDGFKPLLSLRYDDLLTPRPRNARRCKKLRRSNTTESYSGATRNLTTSQTGDTIGRIAGTLRKASKRYTERFGKTTMEKSRTATTSTTWMATLRTTILGILSALPRRNTPRSTPIAPLHRTLLNRGSKPPRNGTSRKRGKSGTETTLKSSGKTPNRRRKSASSAGTSSSTTHKPGSARTPAKRSGGESRALTTSKRPAGGAARRSPTTSTRTDSSVRVSALRDTGIEADVYNLTVLGKPEYYANGVLVHNCLDATRYALFTHTPQRRTDADDSGVSLL